MVRKSNQTVIRERLEYWQSTYKKLQDAYVALVEGGVKSYMIEDRQLTKIDLPTISSEMKKAEEYIDQYESQLNGGGARKAFGVVPRDW